MESMRYHSQSVFHPAVSGIVATNYRSSKRDFQKAGKFYHYVDGKHLVAVKAGKLTFSTIIRLQRYCYQNAAYQFCERAGVKGTNYERVLRTGTYVLPATLSATFDERAFDSPEEFIPQRNRTLGFLSQFNAIYAVKLIYYHEKLSVL